MLRWTLIIIFMLLKAGLIVAVFMHMMWERLALMYAILVPPLLLLVLLGIGAFEADYTLLTRGTFFAPEAQQPKRACPLGMAVIPGLTRDPRWRASVDAGSSPA